MSTDPARREVAAQMARAAMAWLGLLDDGQRRTGTGPMPSDDPTDFGRRQWFYTPTDHGGLDLHRQRPAQQQAAMRLVASGLSEAGFVTVATVIGLENVLDRIEGFTAGFGRERGRDPGLYYLRVFGDPGADQPWGWRFGGHHVSLNNVVVDGAVVATTPCFLGSNPATSGLLGGALHRPLGRVEDLARELVGSMSADLQKRAMLPGDAPAEILTGDRSVLTASDLPSPEGVTGVELDPVQRDQLRALLGTYLDRVPRGVAPSYDGPEIDAVRFAWAGRPEPGRPHYYRLQGPGLLIEWDNTQDDANHAHSVWRDPDSDFGLDVLAQHRAAHHA
jgi:hypothetical protein